MTTKKTDIVESGEIPSGEIQVTTPEVKKTKKSAEMGAGDAAEGKILVDASVLEQMNKRLMAAEARLAGEAPPQPKRVAAHDVRVMFVDEKYPVIEFGKCFEKDVVGRPGKTELYIPITVLVDHESGKTENREMEYLRLMNDTPRYLADIKRQEMSVKTLPQGVKAQQWTTVNPDPAMIGDGSKNFTPRQVTLEHTVPYYRSLIEFREGPLNGVEIEVSNDCFNP